MQRILGEDLKKGNVKGLEISSGRRYSHIAVQGPLSQQSKEGKFYRS
jgi:hypothetical protein